MNIEEIEQKLIEENILLDNKEINYELLFKDRTEEEIRTKIQEGFDFLNSSNQFSDEIKENFKKELKKMEDKFYQIKKK
jgi:ribosomal protein S24E